MLTRYSATIEGSCITLFTRVALIRHGQILRAGPVYQVEVDVAQIKLSQAAEGCLHGPLALVFGTQFTAERLFCLIKWFQETQSGGHVHVTWL